MADQVKSKEGWKWLINSTKAHYFRGGQSLCRRWMSFGTTFEQGNDESPDNCKACVKKLQAERAAA